jgi:hypothetical protein
MSYLDQIADKKQSLATRTEKKEDIDSLIKELKEVQLASLMASKSKSTIILADSTDLGDKVADLGEKIINVLNAFKNDTTATDKLVKISEDFKKLNIFVTKSAGDQAVKVEKALNQIAGAIKSVKMPDIPAPVVKVEERELDFTPLHNAMREMMATREGDKGMSLDNYRAQDINNSEKEVQYIGFLNPSGEWYIVENRVKENTLRYIFGTGGYAKAFAKAARFEYKLLDEAVNAL